MLGEEERFDREERERRAKLFKVLKDEAERSRIVSSNYLWCLTVAYCIVEARD